MKYLLTLTLLLLFSCSDSNNETYNKEIEDWHTERIEKLKSPYGWLSLVDLKWIEEGTFSFGSADINDIKIATKNAPKEIGTIFNYGTTFGANFNANANVFFDGQQIRTKLISTDKLGDPDIFNTGSVQFYLIERDGKIGLRVKDTNAVSRQNFKGVERFSVSEDFKIEATYKAYSNPKQLDLDLMTGGKESSKVPGVLSFTFNEKAYEILPVENDDSDEWFIIFTDKTSGKSTYEACRFIYISKADSSNKTILDFNKAFNPPCAFTDFATCPLPPSNNNLDFEVKAGEKYSK